MSNNRVNKPKEPRYSDQTPLQNQIWDYYCQVYIPNLVKKLLDEKSKRNLSSFYFQLSMGRLRCEIAKYYADSDAANLTQEELANYTKHELISREDIESNARFFAKFKGTSVYYDGISPRWEPNINFQEAWGEDTVALVNQRIRRDNSNVEIGSTLQRGLSSIKITDQPSFQSFFSSTRYHHQISYELWHPQGQMIHDLNPLFQQMINEKSFAAFCHQTAVLIYELSNFFPIDKGSAAVNAWLCNSIAKEKFAIDFDLLPPQYDWFAFYETTEQFIVYFTSHVAVKLIAASPRTAERNQSFLESIQDQMRLDPYEKENFHVRDHLWSELKKRLNESVELDDLPDKLQRLQREIANIDLTYSKPSEQMIEFVTRQSDQMLQMTTEQVTAHLHTLPHALKEHLSDLAKLADYIPREQLTAYTLHPEKIASLNRLWADLEYLRRYNHIYRSVMNNEDIRSSVSLNKAKSTTETHQFISSSAVIPYNFDPSISLDTFNKMHQSLIPTTVLLSRLNATLVAGVDISELLDLTTDDFMTLTAAPARHLYYQTEGINPSKLRGDNTLQTKLNVFNQLLKLHGESPVASVTEPVIDYLLRQQHLLVKHTIQISPLISQSLEQTMRKTLHIYLTDYLQDIKAAALVSNLSNAEVHLWLEKLLTILPHAFIPHDEITRSYQQLGINFDKILKLDDPTLLLKKVAQLTDKEMDKLRAEIEKKLAIKIIESVISQYSPSAEYTQLVTGHFTSLIDRNCSAEQIARLLTYWRPNTTEQMRNFSVHREKQRALHSLATSLAHSTLSENELITADEFHLEENDNKILQDKLLMILTQLTSNNDISSFSFYISDYNLALAHDRYKYNLNKDKFIIYALYHEKKWHTVIPQPDLSIRLEPTTIDELATSLRKVDFVFSEEDSSPYEAKINFYAEAMTIKKIETLIRNLRRNKFTLTTDSIWHKADQKKESNDDLSSSQVIDPKKPK